jgi:hypothetical protein
VRWFERREEEDYSLCTETNREHDTGSRVVLNFEKSTNDNNSGTQTIQFGHEIFETFASY